MYFFYPSYQVHGYCPQMRLKSISKMHNSLMVSFNSSTPTPSIIKMSDKTLPNLFQNILLGNINIHLYNLSIFTIYPSLQIHLYKSIFTNPSLQIHLYKSIFTNPSLQIHLYNISIFIRKKLNLSSWKAILAENYCTLLFWTWFQSIMYLGHILIYMRRSHGENPHRENDQSS
jgi:hypothetical protein